MRYHNTEQSMYKCNWEGCEREKGFVSKSELNRHMLTHTRVPKPKLIPDKKEPEIYVCDWPDCNK